MPEVSPHSQRIQATIPGVATAGATDSFAVGKVPFGGLVTAVSYKPEAASTGDNVNKRVYTLVNKGQTGAGTTVLATLDLTTGNNLAAFDEKAFVLSTVAGAREVAEGDVLAFVSTFAGTGLVDPGGVVTVEIARYYA